MTTRNEYLPFLKWFMTVVDHKLNLPKNVAKDHWMTSSLGYLNDRLWQEQDELSRAVGAYLYRPSKKGATAIIDEAADVAAFAMMVASWVEAERTEKGD